MTAPDLTLLLTALGRGRIAGIQPGLHRLCLALALVGNPQRRMPPTVHVAGTNGKGSTLAFLQALAAGQGLRPHLFLSPALAPDWQDAVQIAGAPPGPLLGKALESLAARSDLPPLTPFEGLTLALFQLFAAHPAPLALIETGMGGLEDATNLLETTVVAAITPIGLDHQAFLGEDLSAIARHKAGILRPGQAVSLSALQEAPVAAVLSQADPTIRFVPPVPAGVALGLRGAHQHQNAALALAAAEALADRLAMARPRPADLAAAHLPGRLQQVWQDQAGRAIWIDGAHNPAGLLALAASLPPGLWDMAVGLMADRPASALAPLLPLAHRLFTVPVHAQERSRSAEDLATALAPVLAERWQSLEAGLTHWLGEAPAGRSLLITGSLTLMQPVLRCIQRLARG